MVSLILFTGFFVYLVLWLHRESKREGYPLEVDSGARPRVPIIGYPAPPPPKTFNTASGPVTVSGGRPDTRALALKRMSQFPGAPYLPTGNPMADGVGPASYAERADVPDAMSDGTPRLRPLRAASGFSLAHEDPSPIGMTVIGGDGKAAGTVREAWIDKAEYVMRYMEVEVPVHDAFRRVLLPVNFTVMDAARKRIHVRSIYAGQFAGVPGLRNPDQVTLLEEDKIMGYYGGGTLYADRRRQEPLA
ncbi:MAG: photosynthetic reaction center subunit H [Aestuariivirga sp.]